MKIRLIIFSVFVLLMISCSGSAPVIEQVEWKVLNRDNGTDRFEELSVFLRASDTDGSEDLASVTVTAGSTEFVWRFPAEDWISRTLEGVEWIGLPGIIPLDDYRLPDALYIIRLEDLAGRGSEISFRPDPDRTGPENLLWPGARLRNGTLILEESDREGFLILRGEDYISLSAVPARSGMAMDSPDAVYWELWFPEKDRSGGFRLGPYLISDSDTE